MGEKLCVVDDGFECAGGTCPDGWYAGVLRRPGCDGPFAEYDPGRNKYTVRDGRSVAQWTEAFMAHSPLELQLLIGGPDGVVEQSLSDADRVHGPAVPKHPTGEPVLAWTERRGDAWCLRLHAGGQSRSVHQSATHLVKPAVAVADGVLFAACQEMTADGPVVRLFTEDGEEVLSVPAQNPSLVGGDGRLFLLVERATADTADLELIEVSDGQECRRLPLPPALAYNTAADMAWDPEAGALHVVAETFDAWTHKEMVGMHREIALWTLPDEADEVRFASGTANGRLPIPFLTYSDACPPWTFDDRYRNLPAIQPRIIVLAGEPAVSFRRFRWRGFKGFGWDVHLTRRAGATWTEPERLSENVGTPETAYSVVGDGDGCLLFIPCCENRPARTPQEEAQGRYGGAPCPATDFRVEVWRLGADHALPPAGVPEDRRNLYHVPPRITKLAPEPPEVEPGGTGRQLLWGDIHSHSTYSKCRSSVDGSPEECLRFQREVLGCRVLTLTDHTNMMSEQGFRHCLDVLDAVAGNDCIPLYSCEPGISPGQHTNFYAIERDVFERLRQIVIAHKARGPIYRRIKKELPAGSVLALRHFHGGNQPWPGTNDPATVETHDPELELAMEAMQNRGNAMMPPPPEELFPLFPTNFLNAGRRVGLVGGSDHTPGNVPNHYCLTGFWTEEPTAEGIWEALKDRKTIACANGKVVIWATCEGAAMGQEVRVSDRFGIRAHVAGGRNLRRVGLVRDGEPCEWRDVDGREAEMEWDLELVSPGAHWYSVTVVGESAYQAAPALAHASPFFVELK